MASTETTHPEGPPAVDRPQTPATLPKACRLRRGADFDAVYTRRLKAGDRHLLLFGRPRDEAEDIAPEVTRAGLSVSKRRHGKSAVKRNRVKRLCREAFRLERHALPPGWDFVLVPQPVPDATLADYRRSLTKLAAKLVRREDEARRKADAP